MGGNHAVITTIVFRKSSLLHRFVPTVRTNPKKRSTETLPDIVDSSTIDHLNLHPSHPLGGNESRIHYANDLKINGVFRSVPFDVVIETQTDPFMIGVVRESAREG